MSSGPNFVDLRIPHIRNAIGNADPTSNCQLYESDMVYVEGAGLAERFELQAAEQFTLVHSTHEAAAAKIAAEGYDLGDLPDSRFLGSFVHVVPSGYPDARLINRAALAYRYQENNLKLVFQFPFPFPLREAQANEWRRLPWGYTPLEQNFAPPDRPL